MPQIPAHQNSLENWYEKGDSGGYFPTVESAQNYKNLVANQPYHKIRKKCLDQLLRRSTNLFSSSEYSNLSVLDFGIGDGGELHSLEIPMKKIYGIDTSEHMIRLAQQQFLDKEFIGIVGGVNSLQAIDEQVDVAFCINTLGYLNSEDEGVFWEQLRRLVKPSGYLVIMTGNLLFDLFALNSGTVEFFASEFKVDNATSLLTRGAETRFLNGNRRNPLKFEMELRSLGFSQLDVGFCMWHKVPPELLIASTGCSLREARWQSRSFEVFDELVPELDKWQLLFRCSIFASVSVRAE